MRYTLTPRTHTKALAVSQDRSAKAMKLFEDLEREFTLAGAEAREVYDAVAAQIAELEGLKSRALAELNINERRAKRVRDLFA